jgi:hypothetical protein
MKVRKLTEEQKNQLEGQTYDGVCFFNPTLDADGNWFISNEEVAYCDKVEFGWINELPEIEHHPVVMEMPAPGDQPAVDPSLN